MYFSPDMSPAKRVGNADDFPKESTQWLVTLLTGNRAIQGWRYAYKIAESRYLRGKVMSIIDADICYRFVISLEAELDYRLHGELLPDCD
jgi:hypothetical protein